MGDNDMNGPGVHEDAASRPLMDGRTDDAKVLAILALASAINRPAAAQEAIANS